MSEAPRFATTFPGQGSQSVGMRASLAEAYGVVHDTFIEASEVLGYDLWTLVQHGPEAELNRTEHTQPAMLTAGVAVWRAWVERGGPAPAQMAGHSLGEYTALVCSGCVTFRDAVRLVERRARLMQAAVPEGRGAMAAILGLPEDQIEALCARAAQDQVVEPANMSAPGQVVVAGDREAVERLIAVAREAGARRAILVAVSIPSHCRLMRAAAEELSAYLRDIDIATPRTPVLRNVDGQAHGDPSAIRNALVRQLYSPVRWVDVLSGMAEAGISGLVECEPGQGLTGLAKRAVPDMEAYSANDPPSLDRALSALCPAAPSGAGRRAGAQ